MKAKHVFTTLGLALVMGLGVGASLLAPRETFQAKADTTSVALAGSFNGWSTTADPLTLDGDYYSIQKAMAVDDTFKIFVNGSTYVGWGSGQSVPSGAFGDDGSGYHNFKCLIAGTYLIKTVKDIGDYGDMTYGITIEDTGVVTYSVDVYIEGVKHTEQVADGGLPVDAKVFGNTFIGWYDDSDCTDGHEVTAIHSNTTVYAKTQLIPQWSYVIDTSFVSTTFANNYLYAFEPDGRKNAEWPGVKMNSDTIVIPDDAKFIINNGGTCQTEDITQTYIANDTLRLINDYTEEGVNKYYSSVWTSTLDEPDEVGYYICGEFSSNDCWSYDDAEKMTDTTGQNVAYEMNFLLGVGDELRVRSFFKDRYPYDQWATLGDNGYADPSTGWGEKHGDNFRATIAGYYDVYAKYENDQFMFYVAKHHNYTLKVAGGAAQTLVYNGDSEYKLLGVDLTAKQTITVYADGVEIPGMGAKLVRNNNLDSFCKVLVNKNAADIYVDISAKTIWVTGMPTGGYHILKNGTTLVEMTHTDSYDGFNQYCSEMLTFAQNDTIEFIDAERTDNENTLPVVFHINIINAGGLGNHFEVVENVITCKTACNTSVYMKLKSGLDEVYFGAVEQYIADAEAFAEGFNTSIDAVCKMDGSTVKIDLETAWSAQATAFSKLTADAKAEVKKGALSSVQAIRDCAAKYEFVYRLRKLGSGWTLDNFLDMDIAASGGMNFVSSTSNRILLVVVVSSVAIIASLGLAFYLLKRKRV